MKNIILILILLFSALNINAQISPPSIQWQKCLGGTLNEIATSIQQTFDGGYIAAGKTQSNDGDVSGNHGGDDIWVVKIDSSGNIRWQKSLGGSDYEFTSSPIQQTSDGGYIVAGVSESNDGDVTGHHYDYVNNIYSDDYWVVKLDTIGNIQWQKCLGGSFSNGACSIQQTSDGGYIVAGASSSNDGDVTGNHGNMDYWLVKLNNSGNIQWQKSLGGLGDDFDVFSVRQTYDKGYIVSGLSESNDGDVSGNHDTSGINIGWYNPDYWL
jgi:hypothetical protein